MNESEIKRLYDEAGRDHQAATAIVNEYAGRDLPAEKAEEVDRLLDSVESRTEQAKRLERASAQDSFLNDPATRREFFREQEKKVKVMLNGRELGPEEIAEFKSAVSFGAFMDFGDGSYQEYKRAFNAYLRKGTTPLSAAQLKALSVGEATAGGYLVQDTELNILITKARQSSVMRRISNVLPQVPSGALIAPTEESIFSDPSWTNEIAFGNEDAVKPFGGRYLQPHPLAKLVKVSNTFLRLPNFDVPAYVAERLGYKFGVAEENGFVNGTGVQQPLGIKNTAGLPTYTTAGSNAVAGDDLINWVYSLPAAYAANARILCNRALIRKVRTLKNVVDGQYIWQPGLSAGAPSTLLDTPYETSDSFDDGLDASDVFEDNAVVGIIGDWSYFWIVDAMGMTVQRLNELYAATNQTGFIGRKEADGMAILAEAFYALKIKA